MPYLLPGAGLQGRDPRREKGILVTRTSCVSGGGAAACVLLFDGNLSETGKERLKIIRESNDGFEIARRDLELRGPGEFLGEQQSGMPMLQFADLDSDAELVETASRTADLMLKQYPEQAARHAARWFSAKAELLKA